MHDILASFDYNPPAYVIVIFRVSHQGLIYEVKRIGSISLLFELIQSFLWVPSRQIHVQG